jgi:peptidyl-prolyl cis-trans isomerase SurA
MRVQALIYLITLSFATFAALPVGASAQARAILVNGELITSHDIVQRTLFQNRTRDFYGRLNALLESDKFKQKARQKMLAAQPRTPADAQRAAGRIKNELIEDATMQVLSERDATRNAVIDSLIGDKLKLQAAKKFGIEIGDEEIEKRIILDRLAEGAELDLNAYYARNRDYGIGRKTIHEVIRAQLAWRAVMNRTYGPATGWEVNREYDSFSEGYLEKLRENAIIEYRE